MAARTARAAETRKKKNQRRIPRPAQSRIQGNTQGVRSKLRKQALLKAGRADSTAADATS